MRSLLGLSLLAACSTSMTGLPDGAAGDPDTAAPGSGPGPAADTAAGADTCPDQTFPAARHPMRMACGSTESGALSPTLEWTEDWGDPDEHSVLMMPAVGALTDDNGDGAIDEHDIPDIVVLTVPYYPGLGATLRVLSGDGSGEHFSVPAGMLRYEAGVALGDIDGDGINEIVAMTDSKAMAFEHTGALKWTSAPIPSHIARGADQPSIADMDGDGDPEIVVGRAILRSDGSLRGAGNRGRGSASIGSASLAADLDGDGTLELVAGNAVYDDNGSLLRSFGTVDGYPAVADFDGDGEPEIVVSGGGRVALFEADGAGLWSTDLPNATGLSGGPPTVADFDGDGDPEVGVATQTDYTVLDGDGVVRWHHPINEATSGTTGASAFDFDADGAAEIVYADEYRLRIFRGSDGAVLFETERHSNGTVLEYPVVADVDGDGEAEIVVAHGVQRGVYGGVSVWGAKDGAWPPGRRVWNQHAYVSAHVDEDGGIPATPVASWLHHNTFRSGDRAPISGGIVDLVPILDDVCLDCDADELHVTARLANQGRAAFRGEVALTLVGQTDDGEVILDTAHVEGPLAPGRSRASVSFDIGGLAARNLEAVALRVEGAGTEGECDTDNNRATWPEPLTCP